MTTLNVRFPSYWNNFSKFLHFHIQQKLRLLSQNFGVLLTIFLIVFVSNESAGQQPLTKLCIISAEEMVTKLRSFSSDKGFKALNLELQGKGFSKLNNEHTYFGLTGVSTGGNGKSNMVEFYAFDYYNKEKKQLASIIWRNDGKSVYKAYLIFPPGVTDFEKALEESVEMFSDDNGKIQLAHSFGKCWKKCVFKQCPGWCVGAISTCAVATATIAIASAGPTAGIGVGAAVAIFAGCASISCATCLGVCAVGCL